MKLIACQKPFPNQTILVHQLSLFIVPFFCVSGLAFRWSDRVSSLHLPRCYDDTWDCCKICKVRCPPLLFCMLTWLARSYREWSQENWNSNHVNSLRFRRCGGWCLQGYIISEDGNPSMRFCMLYWFAKDRRKKSWNRVSSLRLPRFRRCGASCCSICTTSHRPLPLCTNFPTSALSMPRVWAQVVRVNSLRFSRCGTCYFAYRVCTTAKWRCPVHFCIRVTQAYSWEANLSNGMSPLRFRRCGACCCSFCATRYQPLLLCTIVPTPALSIGRLRAQMCANSLRSPIDRKRCPWAWRWPQPASKSCSWF